MARVCADEPRETDHESDHRSVEEAPAAGGCEPAARRWAESLPYTTERVLTQAERATWARRARRLVTRTLVTAACSLAIVGGGALLLGAHAEALTHAFGGEPGLALSLLGLLGLVGAAWTRLNARHGPAARRRTRTWLRRAGALLAVALTVCATAMAPVDALSSLWLRTPWVAIVLIGTGSAALAAWQRLLLIARLPRLLADLRDGHVDVYGPNAHPAGGHAHHRVELLPRSQIVVSRDGVPLRRLETTRTALLAAARPHAYRTALPHGIVRANPDAAMRLQRRSLSSDERDEIGVHIRRLRQAMWPALAAIVAVAAVLGLRMAAEPDWHNLVDLVALGWYALGVVACVGYARRSAAARKLELDRELRWVVTVDDAPSRQGVRAGGIPRLEVLPVSHLAWTEDAVPAAWRLHGT